MFEISGVFLIFNILMKFCGKYNHEDCMVGDAKTVFSGRGMPPSKVLNQSLLVDLLICYQRYLSNATQ